MTSRERVRSGDRGKEAGRERERDIDGDNQRGREWDRERARNKWKARDRNWAPDADDRFVARTDTHPAREHERDWEPFERWDQRDRDRESSHLRR